MKSTKLPQLEAISPAIGSSFTLLNYTEKSQEEKANWHFHPEVELVYVDQGSGKRHIGNHMSYYHDGDLVFIGSNVPHYGFTDRLTGHKREVVVQLKEDFLGDKYLAAPEFTAIKNLLNRGKQGIVFSGETKKKVGAKMEALASFDSLHKLTALLDLLQDLALSDEYKLLNIEKVILTANPQDNNRLEKLYDFVKQEYHRSIALQEVAKLVSMTVPAFSRYFKKKTGKTFTKFVNEHRLVHASKLLAEQPISIADVCYESGFNNYSHFNKLFTQFAGKSPSDYRSEIQKLLE